MIDLHIHSNKSDGTFTPIEILQKAEALKLEYISITDHETVEAYRELDNINVNEYYSGKIIKGIELKSFYKGHIIDILGYNIDLNEMERHLERYFKYNTHRALQTKYLKNFYKQVEELGLKVTPYDELDWDPDSDWASGILYRELNKYPENKEKLPEDALANGFRYFKQHYCYNKDNIFYNDKSKDYPSPEITIEAIHKAGGKAFIAHSFEYLWIKNKIEFWDEMNFAKKADGLECFYSNFSEEEENMIKNYCKENNLYMSGGSDCHGKNKHGISIGVGRGNLKVNKNILTWM